MEYEGERWVQGAEAQAVDVETGGEGKRAGGGVGVLDGGLGGLGGEGGAGGDGD